MLQTPRAWAPIRIDCGDLHGAFSVLAPSCIEEATAFDRVPDGEPDEVRRALLLAELAAVALHRDGARVFRDGEHLCRELDDAESREVIAAVADCLATIAPSYRRSNQDAWRTTLRDGAMHPTNSAIAQTLAFAVDGELGKLAIPRPERFFDIPAHALTDGQLMAFHAARWAVIERHLDQPTPRLALAGNRYVTR